MTARRAIVGAGLDGEPGGEWWDREPEPEWCGCGAELEQVEVTTLADVAPRYAPEPCPNGCYPALPRLSRRAS